MPSAVMVCSLVQLQQLGAGGGAGQSADDGGAVEAPVHLLVLGGVLQGQAHLASDDVGLQQVAARGARPLADGQQCREYGDRRMAEAAEVIVVEGVAHGAVGQGGIGQRSLIAAGEHRGLGYGPLVGDVLLDDLAHRLHRPGQDHPQKVKAGLVGDADGVGGYVLVVGGDDPPGDGLSSAHIGFLPYSSVATLGAIISGWQRAATGSVMEPQGNRVLMTLAPCQAS